MSDLHCADTHYARVRAMTVVVPVDGLDMTVVRCGASAGGLAAAPFRSPYEPVDKRTLIKSADQLSNKGFNLPVWLAS